MPVISFQIDFQIAYLLYFEIYSIIFLPVSRHPSKTGPATCLSPKPLYNNS